MTGGYVQLQEEDPQKKNCKGKDDIVINVPYCYEPDHDEITEHLSQLFSFPSFFSLSIPPFFPSSSLLQRDETSDVYHKLKDILFYRKSVLNNLDCDENENETIIPEKDQEFFREVNTSLKDFIADLEQKKKDNPHSSHGFSQKDLEDATALENKAFAAYSLDNCKRTQRDLWEANKLISVTSIMLCTKKVEEQ